MITDKKNTELIFAWIIFGILILVSIMLILNLSSNYLPIWSDEFMYYMNSKSFYENRTLQAALTYNGYGSVIFGSDSHGFAYPLINGIIATIFGWSNLNIVITNISFVLISVILISFSSLLKTTEKLWSSSLLLMYPVTLFYSFTYMQESIHLLFAVILSLILLKIDSNEKNNKQVLYFIFTILIAGFFRPLWFFFLFSLLPYSKDKKHFILLLIVSISGILFSYWFMILFFEEVPNFFSLFWNLLKDFQFIEASKIFAEHFILNVLFFMTYSEFVYSAIKLIILIALIYPIAIYFKYRSKIYCSLSLVGSINVLLLFMLYDAYGWREIRVLSPFFYFSVVFLISRNKSVEKYVLLSFMILIFIMSNNLIINNITNRNIYDKVEFEFQKEAFQKISEIVGKEEIIYINYAPRDNSMDILVLPLKNQNNMPIRYIVPYYRVKTVEYQYILLRPGVVTQKPPIIGNEFFKFLEN
ncbi:MAG: hypothetical protein JXR90_15180 [Spirochaetes bacterium]|nr:hypothetical protein [Spirochaetota bacterium]